MSKISSITVGVKRLIALAKYENVTYSVEATASIADNESPVDVYEETLAFCQDKIIKEMERMEKGEPPKKPKSVFNDDSIPF